MGLCWEWCRERACWRFKKKCTSAVSHKNKIYELLIHFIIHSFTFCLLSMADSKLLCVELADGGAGGRPVSCVMRRYYCTTRHTVSSHLTTFERPLHSTDFIIVPAHLDVGLCCFPVLYSTIQVHCYKSTLINVTDSWKTNKCTRENDRRRNCTCICYQVHPVYSHRNQNKDRKLQEHVGLETSRWCADAWMWVRCS